MEGEEYKYNKPNFDGRLNYYNHLKSYWDGLAQATFEDNYDMRYKALRGYFARTRPFIKDKDKLSNLFKTVLALIRQLHEFSKSNQPYILNKITDMLQDIEDELFMATKDMLVSTKDEDDDEFDYEQWAKESGM